MRDRKYVAAFITLDALIFQLLPERYHRSVGFVDAHGFFGDVLVPENHVAVQVVLIRGIGVFVSDKGRELTIFAPVVMTISGNLNFFPDVNLALAAILE